VAQPSQRASAPLTFSPMILRSEETSIVTNQEWSGGYAVMTATRISSLIGFTPSRLSAMPPIVPTATSP